MMFAYNKSSLSLNSVAILALLDYWANRKQELSDYCADDTEAENESRHFHMKLNPGLRAVVYSG